MNLIIFRGIKGDKKNNPSKLIGFLLLVGLFLLVVILPNVYACQCIANMPVEQKVIGSDIIFSGKLIEKYENSNYKGFIFEIDKLWKNHSDKILLEQKNISVFTPTQESACGTDFTVGLTYLVYSEMKGERTVTSLCSGSGLLFLKSSDVRHFEENDIQGQEYYQKEHPLIPGSTAKMERDCRDGLLDKYNSPFANGTHWYSNQTCQWLQLENERGCDKQVGHADESCTPEELLEICDTLWSTRYDGDMTLGNVFCNANHSLNFTENDVDKLGIELDWDNYAMQTTLEFIERWGLYQNESVKETLEIKPLVSMRGLPPAMYVQISFDYFDGPGYEKFDETFKIYMNYDVAPNLLEEDEWIMIANYDRTRGMPSGESVTTFDNKLYVTDNDVTYTILYSMENGKITNTILNCEKGSLFLFINSYDDGILKLKMPDKMLESVFMILIDGKETVDGVSIINDIITINYPKNTKNIEMIAYFPLSGDSHNDGVCDGIPTGEIGYEESENTKLARDRVNESDQTFGGSGPALYDKPGFLPIIIILVVISVVAVFLLIKWRSK